MRRRSSGRCARAGSPGPASTCTSTSRASPRGSSTCRTLCSRHTSGAPTGTRGSGSPAWSWTTSPRTCGASARRTSSTPRCTRDDRRGKTPVTDPGGADAWARGPGHVDYEARVDMARLRAGRWERARQALVASGLDAVLVWKEENVRYLTSLRPQIIAGKTGVLNGALFPREGPPVLFVSGGDRDRAEATMPWIGEFHTIPILEEAGLIEHVAREVIPPVLRRRGLDQATVGIDLASKHLLDSLADACPGVRWADGDRAMQAARRVKTPEELALIEEATALAEAVTAAACAAVREGVRECEVAGEAMRALYRLGGEVSHVTTPFVASGERMAPPTRLTTDKVIRWGDLVFVDIGAMWNGYFGDVGRTVVCGTPSLEQRRIYRAVWEG